MTAERQSIRRTFDAQLRKLEQDLLLLGSVVEEMVDTALTALVEQNTVLAHAVVDRDDEADQLDLAIETECMNLLALQQPMSKDLRLIGTVMKAISDLERIGDYSVDIAKVAIRLSGRPYFKPLVDIPRMGQLVKKMVRDTLRAFVERDLDAVQRICTTDDDQVDAMNNRLFDELLSAMQARPDVVVQAAYFLLVTRFLERIADHCTNIAERIHYMETGELVELA
ncbi:MAG: phosphate signaling complex protein PhoU [Armatimonadota bacterium]